VALGVSLGTTAVARAQAQAATPALGFAVERYYPSAPGAGWLVMDDLSMHGSVGGAISVASGYAQRPLVVTDGQQHLAVVAEQAFADIGAAVTYDRWRVYVNVTSPLVIEGQSGVVGGYKFTAPSVDPGKNIDIVSDARIGYDVRLMGHRGEPLRLGASAQLIIPNDVRANYATDGSFRAMLRVLFAGDMGQFAYAGHLGWHIRSLDDSPTPGSPQGDEFLFGAAVGRAFSLGGDGSPSLVVGPEIYGETAIRSAFGTTTTGLEALLSARAEGTREQGAQLRLKLGAGGGLNPHFGAPELRFVIGIEVFDRSAAARPPG